MRAPSPAPRPALRDPSRGAPVSSLSPRPGPPPPLGALDSPPIALLTALLLQSTVFAQIPLAGVKPDLLYLLTIFLAYLEGPSSGALAGFTGGIAEDFLLNQPKGITALTLTLVGYSVGLARQYIVARARCCRCSWWAGRRRPGMFSGSCGSC